jgi:hypothetical protein
LFGHLWVKKNLDSGGTNAVKPRYGRMKIYAVCSPWPKLKRSSVRAAKWPVLPCRAGIESEKRSMAAHGAFFNEINHKSEFLALRDFTDIKPSFLWLKFLFFLLSLPNINVL